MKRWAEPAELEQAAGRDEREAVLRVGLPEGGEVLGQVVELPLLARQVGGGEPGRRGPGPARSPSASCQRASGGGAWR